MTKFEQKLRLFFISFQRKRDTKRAKKIKGIDWK